MTEEIKKEEVEEVKEEAPKEEEVSVLKRIVPPHEKISRLVTEEDVPKVVEEAAILHAICFEIQGFYNGAYAMSHPQIDNIDPLRFFVTFDKRLIINPNIVRHSNYTKDSKEACMTFSSREQKIVQRWQKVEVEYVTIMLDSENEGKFKITSLQKDSLSGLEAIIFQHEIDHLNGIYIYND